MRHPRQNGLMTTMHAVEVAYRNGAWAVAIVAGQRPINFKGIFHEQQFTILCWVAQENHFVLRSKYRCTEKGSGVPSVGHDFRPGHKHARHCA